MKWILLTSLLCVVACEGPVGPVGPQGDASGALNFRWEGQLDANGVVENIITGLDASAYSNPQVTAWILDANADAWIGISDEFVSNSSVHGVAYLTNTGGDPKIIMWVTTHPNAQYQLLATFYPLGTTPF